MAVLWTFYFAETLGTASGKEQECKSIQLPVERDPNYDRTPIHGLD
jgi:hypothetical protein